MSAGTVITQGFGAFGSVALVVTDGYGVGAAVVESPAPAPPAAVAGGSGRVVLLPSRKRWREGWSVSIGRTTSRALGEALRRAGGRAVAVGKYRAVGQALRSGGGRAGVATVERARGVRRFPAAYLEAEDLRLLGIDPGGLTTTGGVG